LRRLGILLSEAYEIFNNIFYICIVNIKNQWNMRKIKKIYWTFFFATYFFMRDLGEKETPDWNARGLIEFLFAFILLGILLFVNAAFNIMYEEDLPYIKFWVFFLVVSSIIINDRIICSKKTGFKKHIVEYEYFSTQNLKKTRNRKVLIVIISAFLFLISSFLITNPNIRNSIVNIFR